MDDSLQLLEIVLFAAIAGVLLFRLRSVLGRRTGNERRRDPFVAPKPAPVPPRQPAAGASPFGAPRPISPGSAVTTKLAAADPSFDEGAFVKGARAAFEMILRAFAAGDAAALQPLLGKEVFAAFADAIHARETAKESLQTNLVAIKAASIVEAIVEGTTALVTVKFVSDQINVTHAADGKVVDGDPEKPVEKTDIWTFSRSVRSRDPNWILIATQSP